jgi:phenylacetate-CoA ligase
MSISLRIYHKLPPWARNVAASLRGYYLNSWRYDTNTEKLVEEILERDYWDKKDWKKWQDERLAFILNRAATQVPFYKNQWTKRRKNGDKASWEYLENWTILEKQTLREHAKEFVAEDRNLSKMFCDHTSGTTGTSLNLWMTSDTVKYWYAMSEARWRRWYGVSKIDKWAILGGQLVTPIHQRKPPFWVWNAGLNQLYMSSYHLAPDLVSAYVDALKKYKISYILGYSSAIHTIAQEIVRNKPKDFKMDVVITNAEPLLDHQREIIAEAFNCPVRETYGMAEMVTAASECHEGNLHQWLDAGVLEIDETNEKTGDFLCTGLVNPDMPLIRYRVGDCGCLSDKKCVCGRTLPLIEKIEGRNDDVLYTEDGRRVGRLDPVFKNDLPIIEAQIIQNSLKEINVKYVPAENFEQGATKDLAERLRERMGDIEVKFEKVTQIPRTNRGKFRAVICNLSAEEKAGLSQQ